MGLRVILLFGFVVFVHAIHDVSWLESFFGGTSSPNAIPQTKPGTQSQFSGTAQQDTPLHPVTERDPEQPKPPGQQVYRHPASPQTQSLSNTTGTALLRPRSHEPSPADKHEPQVQVKFEQRVPVPADSVAVQCGETEVTVEVKQNFLGNGQLIEPSDLTLGDCTAVNSTQHTLLYRAQLQDCDSTMTMTEETLIYTFRLLYSPTPIHDTAIVKTNPAEVVIECHYHRKQLVSSDVLKPTWRAYASHELTQQELRFSLRLMTEDWQSERTSQTFFLNELMHVEATVLQAHHVPLRVYVESCVAALDPSLTPSYQLIDNHGCLMDAKLTGANSYFMPRTQEDKLRFQIKTFRFPQDPRTTLYMICHLKATSVSVPVDAEHKACSFLTEANRWVASGGDNEVCTCCETSSCSERRAARSVAEHTGPQWEVDVSLGPIVVQENLRFEEMEREPMVVQEDVETEVVMEETFSEASPQQATLLQTDDAPTRPGSQWEIDVSIGPMVVQENLLDVSVGPMVVQENLLDVSGPIVVQENLLDVSLRPMVVQENLLDVSGPIVDKENLLDVSLRPIMVQENLRFEEEMEREPMVVQEDVVMEETFSEATLLQTNDALTLPVLLGAVGAALGVVALVFMGAVLHRRRAEAGGLAVCT